jgi:hypothetical protein
MFPFTGGLRDLPGVVLSALLAFRLVSLTACMFPSAGGLGDSRTCAENER